MCGRVFIGACSNTVLVRRCMNCTFTVATRDFKAIECRDCYFFLFTPTEPSLQKCDRIELGPFNGAYMELEQQLITAGLEGRDNNWWRVRDYDSVDNTPTSHYKILSQQEYSEQCEPWLPFGSCEYNIPPNWPPQEAAYALDDPRLNRSASGASYANQSPIQTDTSLPPDEVSRAYLDDNHAS